MTIRNQDPANRYIGEVTSPDQLTLGDQFKMLLAADYDVRLTRQRYSTVGPGEKTIEESIDVDSDMQQTAISADAELKRKHGVDWEWWWRRNS